MVNVAILGFSRLRSRPLRKAFLPDIPKPASRRLVLPFDRLHTQVDQIGRSDDSYHGEGERSGREEGSQSSGHRDAHGSLTVMPGGAPTPACRPRRAPLRMP